MGGYADLLGRRYGDQLDERATRYIDGITSGAERMRGLIDDLLAYSRAGRRELDMRPIDMDDVLEGVRQDLRVAIREAEATVVADGDLPTVTVDQGQIRTVLQNLVANAIKFRGEAPPEVRVSAHEDGEDWRFDVADNGIGIEPRHADRIFRMFQRLHTREEFDGSGIGLALCQRVLARHGGSIWVRPGEAGGSVFSFTLPRNRS
jgi:light-regulated signal transduction histidine kinase (bacteriophytochrome)